MVGKQYVGDRTVDTTAAGTFAMMDMIALRSSIMKIAAKDWTKTCSTFKLESGEANNVLHYTTRNRSGHPKDQVTNLDRPVLGNAVSMR